MLSFNRTLSTRFLTAVNKSITSIGKILQIRNLSALSPEGSGNRSSVKSEASADKARGDEAKYRLSSVGGGNGSGVKSEATAGNGTGGQSKSQFSINSMGWRRIAIHLAVLVGTLFANVVYIKLPTKASTVYEQLVNDLTNMKIEETEKTCDDFYVERKGIENILTSRVGAIGDKYTVVYGSKGVGKSTTVRRVVQNRPGSVWLKIDHVPGKEEVYLRICNIILGKTEKGDSSVKSHELCRALKEVQKKIKMKPVIVFEIERGQEIIEQSVVGCVRSTCKDLVPYADCIIVLSEANAVLNFGNDPGREQFILVNELTVDEARLMFEKRKLFTDYKLTDDDFKEYVTKVGMVPCHIESLLGHLMTSRTEVTHAGSVEIMRANIEQMFINASKNLTAFKLKPILAALKTHPEGIGPSYFESAKYKGVDLSNPKHVAAAMKEVNAILYDMTEKKYKLASHCDAVALESYEPKVISDTWTFIHSMYAYIFGGA